LHLLFARGRVPNRDFTFRLEHTARAGERTAIGCESDLLHWVLVTFEYPQPRHFVRFTRYVDEAEHSCDDEQVGYDQRVQETFSDAHNAPLGGVSLWFI